MVYIPTGYLFYEKVARNSDYVGIRMLSRMEAVNKHLTTISQPSAPLQGCIDALLLDEA